MSSAHYSTLLYSFLTLSTFVLNTSRIGNYNLAATQMVQPREALQTVGATGAVMMMAADFNSTP
jgi:hypothetical protein